LAYAAVTLLFHFVDLRKLMPETQMAIGQKTGSIRRVARSVICVVGAS
jgi:hypothetical protein